MTASGSEKADSKRSRTEKPNQKSGLDFTRFSGIRKEIYDYFLRYPNSNAKTCCKMLKIDYYECRQKCYDIKHYLKKWREYEILGRVLKPPSHRLEWRPEDDEPLPATVVAAIEFEAQRRRPGRGDPKPFDEWYVIPNRNRAMHLVNEFVSMRVFPKSGTFRVLPRKPMDFESLKVNMQNAFFKAGLDLRVCEALSETLEPHSRHRTFKVGPVTPFKIDYYKEPLGITIKADGSHPEHIEVIEDWPSWIKPYLKQLGSVVQGSITTEQILRGLAGLMIAQARNNNEKEAEDRRRREEREAHEALGRLPGAILGDKKAG